jgi:hypothetical protein
MLKKFSLGLSVCLLSSQALAWGPQGHTLIAKTAAELATDGQLFWQAYADSLGSLANVPDAVWKSLPTASLEKPTHYFQIDAYVADPVQFPAALFSYVAAVAKQGQSFVNENGTAPWRGDQMFVMAVDALRRNDDVNALVIAGALAHYIGDLSMPLHVTKKYDGPEGQKTGIHKFFETDNLQNVDAELLNNDVAARAQILVSNGEIQKSFEGDFTSATFAEMARTSAFVDTVLNTDAHEGRSGKGADDQLELAKDRMADGSASLAAAFSKIWRESGRKDLTRAIKAPKKPAWITIDYSRSSGASSTGSSTSTPKPKSGPTSQNMNDCEN